MKTKIIGISGKKQSGKSTFCKYLRLALCLDREGYWGDDWIADQNAFGDTEVFDKFTHRPIADQEFELVQSRADSHCKIYSFADPMKKLICIQILGLSHEQVYGTGEQKGSLTEIKWDNMPLHIRQDFSDEYEDVYLGQSPNEFGGASDRYVKRKVLRSGFMTAREVMQVVGTDLFRKMFFDDVWVRAALNMIKEDEPEVALIEDVRFKTEANAILENGGYLIRLGRHADDATDQHDSEIDLDDFDFSEHERSLYFDNSNMDIMEKNEALFKHVKEMIGND